VTLIERDPSASPFANASALKSKNIKGKGGRKVAGAVARQSGSAAGRLDLRNVSFRTENPRFTAEQDHRTPSAELTTFASACPSYRPLPFPLRLSLSSLFSVSLRPTIQRPQAAQARASAILASQSARKEQRQRAARGNKVEA
jgi:hypothetical protein